VERIIEPASAAKQHSWHPGLAFTLILSYFILFGLTFGSQGVIWANLVTELNLSKGVFGTAQLSGPLLSIVILLQAGPLCTRFGKKRVAMAGLAALTCAIAILALANNLPLLVLALTLSGAGFGLIEVAANSATLEWEHATGG
jgi:MFS family permease